MKTKLAALTALATFLCTNAFAQEAAPEPPKIIQSGAEAPALQVAEWVKGSPITSFEKGKVYLVEFWATWCGPCISNIPHLNELQKKYRNDGLVVIGFTSPDRTPDKPNAREGNTIESVRNFVANRGEAMDYHVAYDLPDRATFKSFFNSPQAPIPQAFIVGRDGKIVAGGHPFYLDEVITDVMAGRWDSVQGPARFAELKRRIRAPGAAKDYAAFKQARAELKQFSTLYYTRTIYEEIIRALEEGDVAEVNRVGDFMISHALETGETGDMAYVINKMVLTTSSLRLQAQPYLALAGRISEAYVTATGGREPQALRLRAEWLARTGDLKSAVGFMRRAVAMEAESQSEFLKERLAELEKELATVTTTARPAAPTSATPTTSPADPRVAAELADWNAFAADFRATSLAKSKDEPYDYSGFRARFDAHAAKYSDMDDKLVARAKDYLGALERNLPGASLAEWPHIAATTTNAALKQLANERAALAESKADLMKKPLEMKFTAADGRPVDLAALRGKVVLIDFWATWCGPCVAELPNVKAVYGAYHDKGFEIVGISLQHANLLPTDTPADTARKLDDAKKKLNEFTTKEGMPWPQYFDGKWWKNDISTKYAINAIPAMFLLDQTGKIVSTDARGEKLEAEVKRLLKL